MGDLIESKCGGLLRGGAHAYTPIQNGLREHNTVNKHAEVQGNTVSIIKPIIATS